MDAGTGGGRGGGRGAASRGDLAINRMVFWEPLPGPRVQQNGESGRRKQNASEIQRAEE